MLSKTDRVGYVRFWKTIDMNFFLRRKIWGSARRLAGGCWHGSGVVFRHRQSGWTEMVGRAGGVLRLPRWYVAII